MCPKQFKISKFRKRSSYRREYYQFSFKSCSIIANLRKKYGKFNYRRSFGDFQKCRYKKTKRKVSILKEGYLQFFQSMYSFFFSPIIPPKYRCHAPYLPFLKDATNWRVSYPGLIERFPILPGENVGQLLLSLLHQVPQPPTVTVVNMTHNQLVLRSRSRHF